MVGEVNDGRSDSERGKKPDLVSFASVVLFEIVCYIQKSVENLEMSYYLFPIIMCGMLFHSETEIELIKVSNTRLSTILLIRYGITFLYTALYPAIRLMIDGGDYKSVISLVTTLLFSTSFSLFYRVLMKTPFLRFCVRFLLIRCWCSALRCFCPRP